MIDVSMTFTPIPEFLARKPKGVFLPFNASLDEQKDIKEFSAANKRDVNFLPAIDAGSTNNEGYLVQQTENYIAVTRQGNTFRNY
jgi:hypothetical protein